MSRVLILSACLLAFGAVPAGASGLGLGWDDCPGGATYSYLRTFSCNTNVGNHTLVVSFVAPAGVLAMSATEIVLDMQSGGATWPAWWSMRASAPAGCRNTSLTQSPSFTSGPFTCFDYWQGQATAGVSMDQPFGNRAKIKALAALPAGSPRITPIPEGTAAYAMKINLNGQKTVGLGSCGGCTDEVCILFQTVRLNQPVGPPANGVSIFMANPDPAQHVLWQGWNQTDPWYQCPQTVPVRQRTWGSIKAIYR